MKLILHDDKPTDEHGVKDLFTLQLDSPDLKEDIMRLMWASQYVDVVKRIAGECHVVATELEHENEHNQHNRRAKLAVTLVPKCD